MWASLRGHMVSCAAAPIGCLPHIGCEADIDHEGNIDKIQESIFSIDILRMVSSNLFLIC